MIREDWIVLFDVYQIILWCVLYYECIRIGFRDKTYAVPYFAICMNIFVETLCLFDYIVTRGEAFHIHILYISWVLLDSMVVFTYFKYGKMEFERNLKRLFNKIKPEIKYSYYKRTILNPFVVLSALLILYIYCEFWKGWFMFVDNLIMSALFIAMLYVRKGSRGQSMSIAFTKCLGTLCATITMVLNGSYVLFAMGIGCFVLDVAYIILLYRTIQTEKAIVRPPKRKIKSLMELSSPQKNVRLN